jgi:hypothetical protein
VVNAEGELEGILSMNDVVRNAKTSDSPTGSNIGYGDVVKTYQAICEQPPPSAASATTAV